MIDSSAHSSSCLAIVTYVCIQEVGSWKLKSTYNTECWVVIYMDMPQQGCPDFSCKSVITGIDWIDEFLGSEALVVHFCQSFLFLSYFFLYDSI